MHLFLISLIIILYLGLFALGLLRHWPSSLTFTALTIMPSLTYFLMVAGPGAIYPLKSQVPPDSKKEKGESFHERIQSFQEKEESSDMTPSEAYKVLGVSENATLEEIEQAHKNLITVNHPDRGGSSYLAKLINEAKTVLIEK